MDYEPLTHGVMVHLRYYSEQKTYCFGFQRSTSQIKYEYVASYPTQLSCTAESVGHWWGKKALK